MSAETTQTLKIETPRLVLRPLAVSDAGAITALADNWNVVQHLGLLPFPYQLHDAEEFLNKVSTRHPVTVFAVCLKSAGETLIGVMGFAPPGEAVARHFGYWLGEPYWGRGYATEAAHAVLTYAREHLGAREIHASFRPENPASARVLTKCGFVVTGKGTMDSASQNKTVEVDLVVQAEDAWKSLRSSIAPVTITRDGGCAVPQSG